MMSDSVLPKAYPSSDVETGIFESWDVSGYFDPEGLPERNQQGAPYCIVLPPPNRTGTLHMGHAKMLAIQDILIRFYRMRGRKTYWVPGTDHAAIATQVKVEQLLRKRGMEDPKKELGREAFLKEVRDFAEQSRDTIVKQCKAMGASMDWKREKYTLDEERNRAVNEMFQMMHEDGLIERGYRIVNWDPQFQTTLSDDEVEHRDTEADLITFKYDADFPIAISTTRPETKFGDTAVAVHPDDERYQSYIGKTFEPVFCGKRLSIKVIADTEVDPSFGTGALGVTPAHSMTDADIAERHGLETVPVIDRQAKMTKEAGADFVGLTIDEARKKIVDCLQADGCLIKQERVPQALLVAERGGARVEQLPMLQWFVRVNKPFTLRQDTLGKWKKGEMTTLKELMHFAVDSEQVRILPDHFKKIYFHWIENLRDWCISRQIWFGHRIPVWYPPDHDQAPSTKHQALDRYQVSVDSPGEGWTQDPDTLDTWFSSGMWTFSVLGWPDKTKELEEYHPTAVLETGKDILFFWVARMVLMSTYALGEVPFKDVYLHGLVRDDEGRKMSKSLDNILDPLELIPKYGTDAVRLSLVVGTSPGQDQKLSEEKVKDLRNFTNKLWNIVRFMLMQIGEHPVLPTTVPSGVTLSDRWILNRLHAVTFSVTEKLEAYQFSAAGDELREFTWNDLADWYLEIAKLEGDKSEVLSYLLPKLLSLWHPFMPYVTECLWGHGGYPDPLMVYPWLETEQDSMKDTDSFEGIREAVTVMRRLRSEQGIDAGKKVSFILQVSDASIVTLLQEHNGVIAGLTRAESVSIGQIPEGWATAVSGAVTIGLDVAGSVDVEVERKKLETEQAEKQAYLVSLNRKLENEEFVSKAPPAIVEEMRAKQKDASDALDALQDRLSSLK